jgi:hypothetical protein
MLALDVLLAGSVSIGPTDALALTEIGFGTRYPAGIEYVVVTVRVAPIASVPSEQGNGVTQSPEFETSESPAGVATSRLVLYAGSEPTFATVVVTEKFVPGVTDAGADTLAETSVRTMASTSTTRAPSKG